MEIDIVSPFPPSAMYDLFDWAQACWKAVADDDSPTDREAFIDFQLARAEQENITTWGISREGELGGYVAFEKHRPWTGDAHCIFKKSFFGRKTTLPALAQIAEQIFAGGVVRIGMPMFYDNDPIRSLVQQLGAKLEGVFTKQVMRQGRLIDCIVYALDPESLAAAHSGADLEPYARVMPRSVYDAKVTRRFRPRGETPPHFRIQAANEEIRSCQ